MPPTYPKHFLNVAAGLLWAAASMLFAPDAVAQPLSALPTSDCPRLTHPAADQADVPALVIAGVTVHDDGSIATATPYLQTGDEAFEQAALQAIEQCTYKVPNPTIARAIGPRLILMRALPTAPVDPGLPAAPCQPRPQDYPPEARRLGQQGRVVVDVLFNQHGMVHWAEVVASSRFVRLDAAALRVVAGCRFTVPNGLPRPDMSLRNRLVYEWRLQ